MFRKNTASQFIHFQGVDATTGGIKSGVTWTIRRCIDGTFAAATGTVTEDSTNGWYKFAMSQADTNGNDIGFNFTGTGAVPQTVNIITTACDPTTATNFGITSLPTTACTTNASLLTSGTGTDQLSVTSGRVDAGKILGTAISTPATAGILDVNIKNMNNVAATAITTIKAVQGLTTADTITNLTNAPTAGDFTATMKTSLNAATPASITNMSMTSGTAQAGATDSITLAAGASAVNGTYDPGIIIINSGTGAGQARTILDYNGTSKVATVDRDWRTNPDATSVYTVFPVSNLLSTNEGLAQAGAASTITLNTNASSVNNTYNGQIIALRGGTGQDQTRIVTAYNGATKVATVDSAWATNPDNTSIYMMLQGGYIDATISSRMATYTQPTGFLAATFPTGTVANTTNITAGTITTATNLTNAPTAGDFTATMKTSLNAATPAVTVSDKTGFSLTAAYDAAKTAAQASDIPTANISAIKTQTDKLTFTVTNQVDVNIQYVNDVQVNGAGTAGSPWGP